MARKSPDAFRTISEVAEILEIPAHVLRFWESRFTQIKPVKRGGGRRYYRPQDIDLLRGIRDLLYDDGLTIKGVQKILRERGLKHVAALGQLPPEADPVLGPVPDNADAVEERVLETAGGPPPNAPPRSAPAGKPPATPVHAAASPVTQSPAPAAKDTTPIPEAAPTHAPAPAPAPAPELEHADPPAAIDIGRAFPDFHLPPPGRGTTPAVETQFDLFSHAAAQDRRPFPPDPARIARRDAMAVILTKLVRLRERMATDP